MPVSNIWRRRPSPGMLGSMIRGSASMTGLLLLLGAGAAQADDPAAAIGAARDLGHRLFPQTVERPLFHPTRRPPAKPAPAPETPVAAAEPASPAVPLRLSQFRLKGIVEVDGRRIALVDSGEGTSITRVSLGEASLPGPTGLPVSISVIAIDLDSVTLRADRELNLSMRRSGTDGSASHVVKSNEAPSRRDERAQLKIAASELSAATLVPGSPIMTSTFTVDRPIR